MITQGFIHLYTQFLARIDDFTNRRHWIPELTAIGTLLALFFGFPSYELIYGEFMPHWETLFLQAQHPFTNSDYHPISHESKLTFRLFIPLLIRYLHLNILSLVILAHITGVLTIYCFIRLSYEITGEKTITVLLTLAFVSLGVAKYSFVSNSGLFDGIAFFFLLLAMLSSNVFIIFSGVFLAAWIDERALIASSLVFIWHLFNRKKIQLMAVLFAWIGYLGIRYYLSVVVGLKTITGGINLDLLINQINSAPLGIFSGIEGFWILILAGLWILIQQKRWWQFLLFTAPLAIVTLVALLVVDMSRSMYYIFPAIFIALKIVHQQETVKGMVHLSSAVLFLSALFPAYVISGMGFVLWQYPLPLQLLRYLTSALS